MHSLISRGAITGVLALLAPAIAPAQQVWTVTNQTELLAAIAAATPGDVVQLAPTGTTVFAPFTLAQGLTLRGPATISFQTAPVVLANIPSGQVAQLVDLTFTTYNVGTFYRTSTVEAHGTVRLDGCSTDYLHLVNADAVIERCQLGINYTGLPAIEAMDSIVSVHGSTLHGSNYSPFPVVFPGAPGILAYGSGSLHVSTSSISGGWGNPHTAPPAPGIQTSVPTWLSDTTVSGGNPTGSAGPGATGLLVNAATTYTARCTIIGGNGAGPRAPSITGNAVADRTLLGVRMTPLQRGQLASIDVIADRPGVPVAILAQVGLSDPQVIPFVTQPLWLGNAPVLVAAGLSGSNAELSLSWTMQSNQSLENMSVSFVGVGLGGAGVQITPTAGGVIR